METAVDSTTPNNPLKPKQKLEGTVLRTSLQGALIDAKTPVPAFLHVSQVVNPTNPDKPVVSVDEVLKVGDAVTVWVRRVLKDHLELTMREPLALEWKEIVPDMVLPGKIVRLENFGAFVELGAERPGLVHVSELSHNYVRVPSEVVKVGDEVNVKVLEVDRRKKQIKLSVKALLEEPEAVEEEVQKPSRKGKAKKEEVVEEPEPEIPDPTFMEIALRQAMNRAEQRRPASGRVKRQRSFDNEADELFERTMKNKINDKE